MKFSISQTELNNQLNIVKPAISRKASHPILGHVYVKASVERQTVKLVGYDLSIGVSTTFTTQVLEGGMATIPAQLLSDIAAKLPDGVVEISVDTDPESGSYCTTTIESGSNRFELRGLPSEEYPSLPEEDSETAMVLPAPVLAEGVKGVIRSASTDETKMILTGIYVEQNGPDLEFAATNGHHLSVVKLPNAKEGATEQMNMVIPARAMSQVEKLVVRGGENDMVTINLGDIHATFEMGDLRLVTRKLDGAYPQYRSLIPKEFARTITFDRKSFLRSLGLVQVFSSEKHKVVKCTVKEEDARVVLESQNAELGKGTNIVPAQVVGGDVETAFNADYIEQGLNGIPSAEIQMLMNGPTTPAVFRPLSDFDMTYLVMPVHIRE